MTVEQSVLPSGPLWDRRRKKRHFDVRIDCNCRSLVNPLSDVAKFVRSSGDTRAGFKDDLTEKHFDQMSREADPGKQIAVICEF